MYQGKMIGTWLRCQWEKIVAPKKYGMTIPWYKYSLKDMFVVYKGTGELVYRYIHGYTKHSLQKLLSPYGTVEMISYVRNEKKVGMFSGKNIIAIVKK
jgi:hypothetical protein